MNTLQKKEQNSRRDRCKVSTTPLRTEPNRTNKRISILHFDDPPPKKGGNEQNICKNSILERDRRGHKGACDFHTQPPVLCRVCCVTPRARRGRRREQDQGIRRIPYPFIIGRQSPWETNITFSSYFWCDAKENTIPRKETITSSTYCYPTYHINIIIIIGSSLFGGISLQFILFIYHSHATATRFFHEMWISFLLLERGKKRKKGVTAPRWEINKWRKPTSKLLF